MAITPGGNLNSVPASQQANTIYQIILDLGSTAQTRLGQQYLPDLMEKEAEVFGPRTISGFLSQVGAEEAMTADQVVWSEQSRLHLSIQVTTALLVVTGWSVLVVTMTYKILMEMFQVMDLLQLAHGIRVNDTCIIIQLTEF